VGNGSIRAIGTYDITGNELVSPRAEISRGLFAWIGVHFRRHHHWANTGGQLASGLLPRSERLATDRNVHPALPNGILSSARAS